MSYPEKGAAYRNEPKWLGREKRAEGGSCGPYKQRDDGGSVGGSDTWANGEDLSPMTVEEKGRDIPMSMKEAMAPMQQQAAKPKIPNMGEGED